MPSSLRLISGLLLVATGLALLAVAVLGARTQLSRNRFAGVRTTATLRSDAAFALANKVAAAPLGAAGAVAVVGGVAVLLARPGSAGWVLLALTGVGTLVLAGVGGAAGDRAAVRFAAQQPAESVSVCGGACAGCDLVVGCRGEPSTAD